MYFLPEQVAEYDKKRMTVREVLQLEFFVIDESSAIQWLRQQIVKKPQTFQELHPQFLREIGGWQKHEKPLELSEFLNRTSFATTVLARYRARFTATSPRTSKSFGSCSRTT